jgi:hydrogenase maturation protein HypF
VNQHEHGTHRLRVSIRGAVQGVGFRPFVYRLATGMGLPGWVVNSAAGVTVEVEGAPARLDEFRARLVEERPPRAVIQGLEASVLDPVGLAGFEIRESTAGEKTALVLPDIATCPDCLRELFDPADRRFRYAFTNCTNCGPRFTILHALPYDRPRTTMAGFRMCGACQAEYDDPLDRRFHAQPNACAACGPCLELWTPDGAVLARGDEALAGAVAAIRGGAIVALKGLGGFHLMADAGNDEAVLRLRAAKAREEKPFALMVADRAMAAALCRLGDAEARLLVSPEAPIVLLEKLDDRRVGRAVAPGNPCLGLMLPYTPLHHLLLSDLRRPVVATSGNRADEPICTQEREALARLKGLADVFLVHDRPIARHADDSVLRVVLGRELMIRRARGYAPMPIEVAGNRTQVLAVGAQLKNAIALSVGEQAFVSQHVGDLETPEALAAFEEVTTALQGIYDVCPTVVACDAHPDYPSTVYARRLGAKAVPAAGQAAGLCDPLPAASRQLPAIVKVQHHVAHVFGCMAENHLAPPALGVAWDGTGYGLDGTIWGGEFFSVAADGVRRVATFRPFGLPGGDQAIREPRRTAAAVLFAMQGAEAFEQEDLAPIRDLSAVERRALCRMLERGVNTPATSSVGRLFDAVAALAGLRQRVRYEGQAAMELEFAIDGRDSGGHYPFEWLDAGPPGPALLDWRPMMAALVADVRGGVGVSAVAARFHRTLAEMIVYVAVRQGIESVVLSGGCFQNRRLTELAVSRLREAGCRPYWHQRIPPNDGGIALGQIAAVASGIRGAVVADELRFEQ